MLFRSSAEVLQVDLLDSRYRAIEMVETGEQVLVRVRLMAKVDLPDAVCGFLIRNRHGIHVYGTNTELQELSLGTINAWEVVEVTFAFECWLAPDSFTLTVAVHSSEGESFDWLDGVLFFRVMAATAMEGITNLKATASTRRLGYRSSKASLEHVS